MDLEGSDLGRIEVSFWHLTGGSEEIQVNITVNNLSHVGWCPGRDWNRAPPKYRYRALLLHQSARLRMFLAIAARGMLVLFLQANYNLFLRDFACIITVIIFTSSSALQSEQFTHCLCTWR
jgi:hypothetical protein